MTMVFLTIMLAIIVICETEIYNGKSKRFVAISKSFAAIGNTKNLVYLVVSHI